jgi:predicted metal-dependent hydrolase
MLERTHSITYGESTILFQVSFSSRKSLEIAVHPDKSIFVKAPIGTHIDEIEIRVHKRARWIKRQIHYFDQFDPRTPVRKYVGGETHLYLGKKYRLKISQSENNLVCLKNGYFLIDTKNTEPEKIKILLNKWYREKAHLHLHNIFNECWEKFRNKEYPKPACKILQLEKRWGSLSKSGTLSLNVQLIKTPKECIEYVIIHELCHLVYHNHSRDFFKLLEVSLPDWMQRKYKLEMSLT